MEDGYASVHSMKMSMTASMVDEQIKSISLMEDDRPRLSFGASLLAASAAAKFRKKLDEEQKAVKTHALELQEPGARRHLLRHLAASSRHMVC